MVYFYLICFSCSMENQLPESFGFFHGIIVTGLIIKKEELH